MLNNLLAKYSQFQAKLNTKAFLWGVKHKQFILSINTGIKLINENLMIFISFIFDLTFITALSLIIYFTFIAPVLWWIKLFLIIVYVHGLIVFVNMPINRVKYFLKKIRSNKNK